MLEREFQAGRPSRVGVLLINLGTPDSTSVADVRRYLAEFLMDPLVIDLPVVPRWLLVHGIILRSRPRKSAEAYRQIWSENGSPLLLHGQDLVAGLRARLGDEVVAVELAMRYQNPGIAAVLADFNERGIDDLLVLPLFPQFSKAAWTSAVQKLYLEAGRLPTPPNLRVVPPYYEHPAFVDAAAAVARPVLDDFAPDMVLLSFHGLPESHCRETDSSGQHCLVDQDCCARIVHANRYCYRAQCYATARALARSLGLGDDDYEVSFQSRFTDRWIKPFTDHRVPELARAGVRRLAVLCPAFVADCLETLEEIGIRAAADFRAAGGDELRLVPCVNASPAWIDGAASLIRANLPRDQVAR